MFNNCRFGCFLVFLTSQSGQKGCNWHKPWRRGSLGIDAGALLGFGDQGASNIACNIKNGCLGCFGFFTFKVIRKGAIGTKLRGSLGINTAALYVFIGFWGQVMEREMSKNGCFGCFGFFYFQSGQKG